MVQLAISNYLLAISLAPSSLTRATSKPPIVRAKSLSLLRGTPPLARLMLLSPLPRPRLLNPLPKLKLLSPLPLLLLVATARLLMLPLEGQTYVPRGKLRRLGYQTFDTTRPLLSGG